MSMTPRAPLQASNRSFLTPRETHASTPRETPASKPLTLSLKDKFSRLEEDKQRLEKELYTGNATPRLQAHLKDELKMLSSYMNKVKGKLNL